MRDKRSVDSLSTEELEQIILIRRRQERSERLRRLGRKEAAEDCLAELEEGAVQPPAAAPSMPAASTRRRGFRDMALLLLEVLALVALIAVLVASVFNLRKLNQEAAMAREATPAPTALVVAEPPSASITEPQVRLAVLPGGHTPPTSRDSIPQRLADLVQPVVPAPIPTPGPSSPTRIVIPSIHVDAPVVEGDDWEQLKKGAGHTLGTANPGERGNCFISAHNDIFGEIFRRLDEVELGDKITLYAGDTPYHYVVKAKRIVEPTDVSVMAPTASAVLTLMTCYPYMIDTHRLVVIAELTDD